MKTRFVVLSLLILLIGFSIGRFTAPQPLIPPVAVSKDDYPAVWKQEPRGAMKDSWRMGNRECTSWVAYKVFQTFKYQTTAWEDAMDWPAHAKSRALVVDETPEVHSAAVNASWRPGHVAWVERINDDGTIHVSQYNADNTGEYSEADISTAGLVFIHFKQVR